MKKKIKIAFIKYGGLGAGGTERFLQTIAANLPDDDFDVDFYWCETPKCPKDPNRLKYMQHHGINLIEFKCSEQFIKKNKLCLKDSNFFDVYKNDYDLIQTGRCGLPEEPFCRIKNIPIIDSIHYVSGTDNQYNIARVMHISEFSRNMWIKQGGDKRRVVMISHPIRIPDFNFTDIREKFNLPKDKFIFGFHQRNSDDIFSDIPLRAYQEIEDESNAFIICGGSNLYRKQAKELGLKNVYFIEHTSSNDELYSFLKSLNVYAHGRKDGELNSIAIAEALFFGLPVITHPSDDFNGHLEIVTNNGFVAKNPSEYAIAMKKLQNNPDIYKTCSDNSLRIFHEKYDFNGQLKNIINIYKETVGNPYPNKLLRTYLALK